MEGTRALNREGKLKSQRFQVLERDRNDRLMAWEGKGGMREDEKEREELKEGKMRASGYCGDG